jgi:hypothetical protein
MINCAISCREDGGTGNKQRPSCRGLNVTCQADPLSNHIRTASLTCPAVRKGLKCKCQNPIPQASVQPALFSIHLQIQDKSNVLPNDSLREMYYIKDPSSFYAYGQRHEVMITTLMTPATTQPPTTQSRRRYTRWRQA